jgi:NADH:ubiquinone oxidoreductase subunit D
VDPHRLAELRSVALHAAIGERLLRNPELVEEARRRLRATSTSLKTAHPYRVQWLRILEEPLDRVVAFLREDSERARELRQCTPFTGVITPRERWRIWRTVREST